ncbi:hypothetical protein ACF06W_11790 [Streptomyces albus]|uniref:hypothetical protein n=1 Tax=Streptomyces albus TaxID=1888 RepID=UPI0036FAD828
MTAPTRRPPCHQKRARTDSAVGVPSPNRTCARLHLHGHEGTERVDITNPRKD